MIRTRVWNRKNRRKEIGVIRQMNQATNKSTGILLVMSDVWILFFFFFSSEDDRKIETAGP